MALPKTVTSEILKNAYYQTYNNMWEMIRREPLMTVSKLEGLIRAMGSCDFMDDFAELNGMGFKFTSVEESNISLWEHQVFLKYQAELQMSSGFVSVNIGPKVQRLHGEGFDQHKRLFMENYGKLSYTFPEKWSLEKETFNLAYKGKKVKPLTPRRKMRKNMKKRKKR